MHTWFTILATVLILVNGALAQGFLGRLKKEAIDTAKQAANEAMNQSEPAPISEGVERKEREAAYKQQMENADAENEQRQKQWEAYKANMEAERQAAIEKMEAERKEREAKREADKAKMEAEHAKRLQQQKEERERREKEEMERAAREKREGQNEVFDDLRNGEDIQTAEQAETRLRNRGLWEDGLETKIKEVIAERMSKAAQNKFPMSDTFKAPVKIYKEFESGMSLEWCKAKLETEGKKIYTANNKIELGTDDSEVTLIFNELGSGKPPVLTACVVKLPAGIPHTQVLEKYKNEFPNVKVKHEKTNQKLPAQKNYVMDGNTLDTQFSMIQVSDTIESPDRTVTIEFRVLAGKAYIADYNSVRKVLVCEAAEDGTVTVPNGLDARQKAAADVVKDQVLPAIRQTAVLIEDTVMARTLKDMQEAERKNEQEKQQKKNAAALEF